MAFGVKTVQKTWGKKRAAVLCPALPTSEVTDT